VSTTYHYSDSALSWGVYSSSWRLLVG